MEIARIDDEARRLWREHHGDARSPTRRTTDALAARLREAIRGVLLLDAERCDDGELAELVATAGRLVASIDDQPRISGTPATAAPPASLLFERSPVTGRGNAAAPPLTVDLDGERTIATVTYSETYEGPPGGVHGGVVAATFDEVLGIAQISSGVAGFTGTLNVRFRRITPIHRPIRYEAWVEGREGRKLTVRARSTVDGDGDGDDGVLAEASGLFVAQITLGDDRAEE